MISFSFCGLFFFFLKDIFAGHSVFEFFTDITPLTITGNASYEKYALLFLFLCNMFFSSGCF